MTEKMKKEMLSILTDLYKMEARDLCTFDVRDYEFSRVVNDARRPESKLRETVRESLDTDWRTYEETANIVVKTVIGKKWANPFNYDYDASLFANLLYQKTMLPSGSIEPLNFGEYEYMIFSGGIYYRGDTMNSWQTTLNKFIREHGEPYFKSPIPRGSRKLMEFLSNPENYTEPLPSYITEFMKVVYTIGNFIPVPLVPSFNIRRNSLVSDYWDLALLAIYRHYMDGAKSCGEKWQELFQYGGTMCWLDWHGTGQTGWDDFVERNFLQDFVKEREGGGYGEPKPLWEKHFLGEVRPQEEGQFKQFFTNASSWILARGNRIAISIKKKLEGKSDPEALESLARQMIGEPV